MGRCDASGERGAHEEERRKAMNQSERRLFLIKALLDERPELSATQIPSDTQGQRLLLRALFNTRQPGLPADEVLRVQDDYLTGRIADMGVTNCQSLVPVRPHVYLWQGDITTLACDAIVNAANSGMTGCWAPNHICIDNCIHTFAGMQLRWECAQLMETQGHFEPTGQAKITKAYNLPSKHVIHTVGPIANGSPTNEHRRQLAESYRSCYELVRNSGLRSLAYCCISTGVFGFPQEEAARIATETVLKLQAADPKPLDVIFNVFEDRDLGLYSKLLP